MKLPCLFGKFVSYEENEVAGIQSLGTFSLNFIFFITYEWSE
jgi:hypothetical protein